MTYCFVVRQRYTTIGHEGICINRGASDDEGLDLFAHTLRWYTDHRRLDHRRVPVEHLFDVAGVDIEPAANNQVLLTFNDIQVTIFIEASHIARVQPPIPHCRLRLRRHIVVALDYVGAACDNLTNLADRDGLIVFIYHQHFNIGERLAHRARLLGHVYAVSGEGRARFREAIAFKYAAAKFLFEALQDGHGQRGRATDALLQAAAIMVVGVG